MLLAKTGDDCKRFSWVRKSYHRFQTIHGECANNDWDCRPENVETYHTRSEVSHPKEYRDFATIGDTTTLSYEVYIAKNPTVDHLAVYDDWFNFGQLHGSGDEDVPISIAVANYDGAIR